MLNATLKRWIIRFVKITILALVAWGIYKIIGDALHQAKKNDFDLHSLQPMWLVFGAVVYLVGQIPSAVFYYAVIKELGQKPDFYQTFRAHVIGHIGKYAPGKALVVVLRTSLTLRPRVAAGPVIAAVFYETLTLVATGAVFAVAVLIATVERDWTKVRESLTHWDTDSTGVAGSDPKLFFLAFVVAAATAIPTIPAVFRWLLRHLKKIKLKSPSSQNPNVTVQTEVDLAKQASPKEFHISTSLYIKGWIGMIVGWLFMGTSLWAVVHSLGQDISFMQYICLMTASVALAIGAGFVSFIPGGFGVREFVFMMMLGPIFSDNKLGSIIAPLVLRVLWLVAELIAAGVLWTIKPRDRLEQTKL